MTLCLLRLSLSGVVSVEMAATAGVPAEHVIVDPGIGFGKQAGDNLEILRHLEEFKRALAIQFLLARHINPS